MLEKAFSELKVSLYCIKLDADLTVYFGPIMQPQKPNKTNLLHSHTEAMLQSLQ